MCVCSRLNHALTAALIEFIFGMYIDVVPGSNIGILVFSILINKDHLWTRYLLCDVPYVQKTLIPYVQKTLTRFLNVTFFNIFMWQSQPTNSIFERNIFEDFHVANTC